MLKVFFYHLCIVFLLSYQAKTILEQVAFNNTLSLNATRDDGIFAKVKSFWGSASELQTNPMPLRYGVPH